MMFHDTYIVKRGDNLTKIGKEFGFANPGPIVAYTPNQARFRGKSPDLIYPNERLLIPWRRDLLQKYVATCKHLMSEVAKDATKLINEQMHNKKDLDQFLTLIDAVNLLASTAVGIGMLVRQGARGVEMSSKEAIKWLLDSRAALAGGVTTLAIPTPTAPKKDFKFYVRHTLGPWNPSFWASVYVAIQEKDVDLYLYGSDATAYKTSVKIKTQAESDIANLKQKVAAAESQMNEPFYNHKI
jgi:hypothetical protein